MIRANVSSNVCSNVVGIMRILVCMKSENLSFEICMQIKMRNSEVFVSN